MRILVFCQLIIFLISCNNKEIKETTNEVPVVGNEPTAIVPDHQLGKDVYLKFCLACHQSDGTGLPGMYPPLTGTPLVNGDKGTLIEIIVKGLSGPIEVLGEIYDSEMPAHPMLTNQEIAELLTYVRSSFGNSSSPVTIEEVELTKKKLEGVP